MTHTQPAEAGSVKRYWAYRCKSGIATAIVDASPVSMVLAEHYDAALARVKELERQLAQSCDAERNDPEGLACPLGYRVKELERVTNYHENCKTCRCVDKSEPVKEE